MRLLVAVLAVSVVAGWLAGFAAVPVWAWVAVTIWAAAVLASEFLHARRTGEPFLGIGRGQVIRPPGIATSRLAADERRERLTTFLRRFDDAAGVPQEFLEIPPGSEAEQLPRYSDDETQYWRAARLHMQLEADQLLLLERVTDALVHFERQTRLSPADFPVSIRLERIRRWWRDILPWRVVVTAGDPASIMRHLNEPALRDWFGIAIRVHRPWGALPSTRNEGPPVASGASAGGPQTPPAAATVAHGRCRNGGDGLDGTVGGIIGNPHGPMFGVTCAHVLSASCADRCWPIRPPESMEFTEERPDVALIQPGQPCFPVKNGNPAPGAVQADIELAVARESEVVKHPQNDNLRGRVITASASGFKLGEHYYRGPHFHITPYFVRRFGIIWPLCRRFSKPGHSGAWVWEAESRKWLGMVIGGFGKPNTLSVALSSEFIREAFARSGMAGRRGNERDATAFFAGG